MIDWSVTPAIVTGGAGFIGSHVVDELISRGCTRVFVFDDLRRGHLENLDWARQHGDVVMCYEDLADGVPYHWYGNCAVFHMAARVTNIQSNQRDHLGMLQDNLAVNLNVIEAMMIDRPRVAVLCSTVCVYPHDAPVPTPEAAAWPLHPEETNEGYGLAKGILEKQAEFLHREHHIPTVVTRFSNAIGKRDYYDPDSSHVIPALIRRIAEGEDPLRVWGSGKQTRVFVDAIDLAVALVSLAETPAAWDAQPVNIGHKREVSIAEVARLVAKACGKPDLAIEFDTSHPDGHARRAVDNSRLQELVGWVPAYPLEESIEDMVAEYAAGESWL
jgi:GDP-L-fucose synthase